MSSRTKVLSLVVLGVVAGLVLGSMSVAGAAPDAPVVAVPEIEVAQVCPGAGQGSAACGGSGTCEVTGEECVPGEACGDRQCATGEACVSGGCGEGERRGTRAQGGAACGGSGGAGCGEYGATPPVTY